jgi:hypothetical protein
LRLCAKQTFQGSAALSVSGLPAGVTAIFNPTPASCTSSTTTFAASSAAAAGTVTVTITGAGGGLTRSTTLILPVDTPPAPGETIRPAINVNYIYANWAFLMNR